MPKRGTTQRIISKERLMRSGKLGGYSYTIETKEEACRRASEKALQQAKTQNQSEDCQLGEEKDRLTKSAGWKIGKLELAMAEARDNLKTSLSYQNILRQLKRAKCRTATHHVDSDSEEPARPSLRRTTTLIDESSLYGVYEGECQETLLPQIKEIRCNTYNPTRRRELLTRKLLGKRKPMPYPDRSLPDVLLFSMAEKMVSRDRRKSPLILPPISASSPSASSNVLDTILITQRHSELL